MQLYILRHGKAEPQGLKKDFDRELLPMGVEKTQAMARWFQKKNVILQHVLCSPYVRAKQTFDVFQKVVGDCGPAQYCEQITPDANPKDLLPVLAERKNTANLLLVGHMPFVGRLVEFLVPDCASADFATSGMACVELDVLGAQNGRLLWQVDSAP